MSVAVLGIGGVGGLVAARTGAVCVASERTAHAIAAQGLRLRAGGAETATSPEVVPALSRPVDVLVVAVKAYALGEALGRISEHAVADAVVLPLLNGLEHLDAIRAALPGAVVVAGSIGRVEVYSPEPGLIVQRTPAAVVTAASDVLTPGELRTRLAPIGAPGLELVIGSSEPEVLWEKATRLAVLAAATVAAGGPVGVVRDDPDWRRRLESALSESCAVARAAGVDLAPAEQLAIIDAMAPELTPSTARDVAAGRPSELDAIAGAVVRAGARLGVPTPELAAMLEEATCRAQSR